MNLAKEEIEEIAERLVFPVLLTKGANAASFLYKDLPLLKGRKPSEWTFYLDESPLFAVYAVWLVVSEQPLRDYLANWQFVKPFTTGDDLKQCGLMQGPKYKEILSRLRAAWLDGDVMTEYEEKNLLRRIIAEN
jgi:tRNA nucleotidyltransferase (CCA-adding enzyme)